MNKQNFDDAMSIIEDKLFVCKREYEYERRYTKTLHTDLKELQDKYDKLKKKYEDLEDRYEDLCNEYYKV